MRHQRLIAESTARVSFVRAPRAGAVAAAVAAALGLPMAAPQALAQQQSAAKAASLDEVIVTARKRDEDVQSVPQSIEVIGGLDLKELGKVTFKDLQFEVPGFYIQNYETRATIAVRGVGSQVPGGGQSVAAHINGIYQASTAASLSWVFDIDRVEVLKGPQGTLYGRNSTGGAVNIITRRPGDEFGSDVSIEFGDDNRRRFEASLDAPLGEDWAVRLAGTATRSDGRITNRVTGKKIDGNEFTGGRITLAGQVGSVDVELFGQKTNETGGSGELIALDGAGNRVPKPLYGWDQGYYDEPTVPKQERDYAAVGLTLSGDLGNGYSWKSITGYIDYSEPESFLDVNPVVAPVRVTIRFPQYAEQITQELQLQHQGERADWIIGALYMDGDEGEKRRVDILPPIPGALNSDTDNNVKTTALFGDINYKLTDAMRLNLGLRYNRDEVRNKFVGRGPFDGQTFDLSSTQSEPTGRIGVDYTTAAGTMFYTSFARGFQGGYNTVGFDTAGNPRPATVKPETLNAFEAGMKSTLGDGRGIFNLAAFYYDYKDMQVRVGRIPIGADGSPIPGGRPFYTTLNAGKAEIYGLETELSAYITDHLRFDLNAGYLKAEFDEYLSINDAGARVDYSGNTLPRAPEFSGSAALVLDDIALGSATGSLRLEYQYRGDAFDNADNLYVLPETNFLNLLATVDFGKWRVWAGGRNLTDQKYFAFYDGRNFGYPGQFRSWNVGASYSFR
jgi:iron complex outermembrane receptor protein